jgi:hypothetical protein
VTRPVLLLLSAGPWAAFLGLRLAGLGQFGAELVDLAAVGVMKVFDALFTMDALTLDVGPGRFTLRRQRRHVAAYIGHRLAGGLKVGTDTRQLAPCLFGRGLLAVSARRLRLSAALGHSRAPLCHNPGPFLCPGPFGGGVTFAFNQRQLGSLEKTDVRVR